MNDELALDGAAEGSVFTVSVEQPWLLHLAGELDGDGATALIQALEGPIRRGGTIGLDLSELRFMDSTGINVLCNAAQRVRDRGRIVLIRPTPSVCRIIEVCGLTDHFDVSDDPSSARPD